MRKYPGLTRRVTESAPLVVLRRILTVQAGPGQFAGSIMAPVAAAAGAAGLPSPSLAQVPALAGGPGAPATCAEFAGASTLVGFAGTRAAEGALAREAAAPLGAGCGFVTNSVTGVAQRVVLGFDGPPPAGWVTACGWRFGLSIWRAALVQPSRHDLPGHLSCSVLGACRTFGARRHRRWHSWRRNKPSFLLPSRRAVAVVGHWHVRGLGGLSPPPPFASPAGAGRGVVRGLGVPVGWDVS